MVVEEKIDEHIPKIIVQGAVCRPGWLVEIEGVAIHSLLDRDYPAFK